MILVTGGAGFIGSNFVLDWLAGSSEAVLNLDKLTYAGNLDSLASVATDPRHVFVQGDIADRAPVDVVGAHRALGGDQGEVRPVVLDDRGQCVEAVGDCGQPGVE